MFRSSNEMTIHIDNISGWASEILHHQFGMLETQTKSWDKLTIVETTGDWDFAGPSTVSVTHPNSQKYGHLPMPIMRMRSLFGR